MAHKENRKKGARIFRTTAAKTTKTNTVKNHPRGGIRL